MEKIMKTIKRGNQVKRVSDKDALSLVEEGWEYCLKSEWKAIRDGKTYNSKPRKRK